MMKYYLKDILKELIRDKRLYSIDGIVRENDRKVYLEGQEYQEYSLDLIFTAETGNLFKRITGFTVRTNSFNCTIVVIKHYTEDTVLFNRKPAKNIVDYIINELMQFKNQDREYLKVN